MAADAVLWISCYGDTCGSRRTGRPLEWLTLLRRVLWCGRDVKAGRDSKTRSSHLPRGAAALRNRTICDTRVIRECQPGGGRRGLCRGRNVHAPGAVIAAAEPSATGDTGCAERACRQPTIHISK
jgi:hypothetical protein